MFTMRPRAVSRVSSTMLNCSSSCLRSVSFSCSACQTRIRVRILQLAAPESALVQRGLTAAPASLSPFSGGKTLGFRGLLRGARPRPIEHRPHTRSDSSVWPVCSAAARRCASSRCCSSACAAVALLLRP